MATVKVTDASFADDVLHSDLPVVVDFWAEWCGPCRMIAPALDEIATEMAGRVRVAKVNIDENQEWASRFNIRSIPAMLLFKDGEKVAERLGAAPKSALQGWIEGAIAG